MNARLASGLRDYWRLDKANSDDGGILFDLLAGGGGLFHTTSRQGFAAIESSGAVVANTGQFPHSCSASVAGFAYRNGLIALFDFDPAVRERAVVTFGNWGNFFLGGDMFANNIRIALRLNREALKSDLRPYVFPPTIEIDGRLRVPKAIGPVEAWHPGPIAVEHIEAALVYRGRPEHRGFEVIDAGRSFADRVLVATES